MVRIPLALREALSRGAVGSIARRLFRGFSLANIQEFAGRRFGISEGSLFGDLLQRAQAALTAGQALRAAGPNEQLPLSVAPVNRFLGFEVAEGNRVITEVIIPWWNPQEERGGGFDTRILSEDILTPAQLDEFSFEFVAMLQEDPRYPDLLERLGPGDLQVQPAQIPALERRF